MNMSGENRPEPRKELSAVRDHIVAEGKLIETEAARGIAAATDVVARMHEASMYEGWEAKYVTAQGPTGLVGCHSRKESIDGFLFHTGSTPLDDRIRRKMVAYEALLPECRHNSRLHNVDNTSFFDIETTGVGAPYMNFFGFLPVGTDGLSIYKLGVTRVDYFEYAGPRENPNRESRWTPIIISLYGNLSPALYAPVYRPQDRYWGFFDVHWDLPGLMSDTIEKSASNLLVVAHDPVRLGGNSILIGINRPAQSAVGIEGFVRGRTGSVETLMLEKHERGDIRELAAGIKSRAGVFSMTLNGRRFDVYTLHEPAMLTGFTVVRVDETSPCHSGG